MIINYKKFIEDNFAILDKDKQIPVPYKFNAVQDKYYNILMSENPEMDGVREIVLKARQEGMSSFILALFAVDFLLRPFSVSICISHRKDSTDLLFKKVKFYLTSYFQKLAVAQGLDPADVEKQFLKRFPRVRAGAFSQDPIDRSRFIRRDADGKHGGHAFAGRLLLPLVHGRLS